MTDMEKLNTAKVWIEKLANGVNPLTDETVKDGDLINNVHISRCLFYVAELLGEIKLERPVRRYRKELIIFHLMMLVILQFQRQSVYQTLLSLLMEEF